MFPNIIFLTETGNINQKTSKIEKVFLLRINASADAKAMACRPEGQGENVRMLWLYIFYFLRHGNTKKRTNYQTA